MPVKQLLTKSDEHFIRANRLIMSGKAMAKHLGYNCSVIQRYLRKHNLQIQKDLIEKFRVEGLVGKTTFTVKEDKKIRRDYLKKPVKVLAAEMGRSFTGIMGRLKATGLEIPKELRAERKNKGCFQAAHVPFNKGKKMSKEMYEKCKATMFQPGQLPTNTKHDGAIAIRFDHEDRNGKPYKYIRIKPGEWVPLHRYKWEKKHGPIPENMILQFQDGDTMNCKLSNLFLSTRRDNMLRNSAMLNLSDGYVANTIGWIDKELKAEILKHPELIELKRTQLQLKRAIYAKQKSAAST